MNVKTIKAGGVEIEVWKDGDICISIPYSEGPSTWLSSTDIQEILNTVKSLNEED